MKRRQLATICCFIATISAGVTAPSSVGALPTLPPNFGDITPDINWDRALSPLIQSSEIACTITSVKGSTSVVVGQKLSPFTNLFTDGLTLVGLLKTPTAEAGAECTADTTIPSTPINVSGTFSAPEMESVAGVGNSGNISLVCSATSATPTISVVASARFGGAVPNKAQVIGKSAVADINFQCGLTIVFSGGAGLVGTVAGKLKIADAANTVCAAVTATSCIQLSMTDAAVDIIGGSGALADAVGSGTYSLSDYFSLTKLDENIEKVKAMNVRVVNTASNADQLKLVLLAGKHKVKLISPTLSGQNFSFGKSTTFNLVSAPKAICKITSTMKGKTIALGTATIDATGSGSVKISSSVSNKMKAAGIKSGSTTSAKIACKTVKSTTTLSLSGKYTG